MSAEDLDRVKTAHAEALRLPVAEREAFLGKLFPDEPELYQHVIQLVQWHDEAGDFLSTPVARRILDQAERDLSEQRIGPWELIRELGHGGSATVFLARRADDLFEKQVAIKVLNRLSHSEEVFRRFQREIQILARVDHPHIVRFLEAGTTKEALAYIVTEFIDGQRIDEFAASISLRDKLQLFLKVCEGVEAAHKSSIVHRDIKPSNILVTHSGVPKLLDFGIAILTDRRSELTESGMGRMTVQYASPEQIRGEKEITASADVYSLGVVLYQLISGRLPHPFPPHELWSRVLSDEPLPLEEAPSDLAAIVFKALEKQPRARYGSVRSLADELNCFLEGNPVQARGKRLSYRAGKHLRRWWVPLGVAGVVICLLVAVIFRSQHQPKGNSTVRVSLAGVEGQPLGFSFSPDGRHLYFLAGDPFYNYADLYRKDLRSGSISKLTADGAFKASVKVSPNGRLVAIQRPVSEDVEAVSVLPAGGGNERQAVTGRLLSFAWGADSRSLIISQRSESGIWPHLRGYDIEKHEWWEITPPPKEGRGDHHAVLSPDGHTIAFVRQEARESADLFLVPVDSALRSIGSPRRLTSRRLRIMFPHWTADGKQIFYAGGTLGNFKAFRVAADGRSDPVEIEAAGGAIETLALSPHSSDLIIAKLGGQTNIRDLTLTANGVRVVSEKKMPFSTGHEDGGEYSGDGRFVSFVSKRSGEFQVWIAKSDGTEERQLTNFASVDIIQPLWLRDSAGLVVSVRSRTVGLRNFLFSLAGGERELTGVPGIPCSFSRDGQWMYFSQFKKDVDIYKFSMVTGEIRRVTHDVRGAHAVESPDGQTVYFTKPEAELGLWRIPAVGGRPVQVLASLARRSLFEIRPEGIYYVAREARSAVVRLRRFADGAEIELYRTRATPEWGFSVSSDARRLLLTTEDSQTPEVLLLKAPH